ncbi:putative glycolate oxidase [Colletotrichum sublineola]|uniref:Putative glycolate oxidase n=1 Tax=Colletotrichum sublineola TaxID=1173701 RepID=A0A066XYV2_COLSU|nr:putative glycolate oxidase [Colletotrichum sublineola]
MAFRAFARYGARPRSTAPCRTPARRHRPSGPAFGSPRSGNLLHTASSESSKRGGRFIALQVLALGAIPLLAGYLLGRSASSAPSAASQGKLSRVEFANRRQMLRAADEISEALGKDAVSFDEDEIEMHGHSDWSTSNSSGRPVAIVYPRTTEDVSKIAKICNRRSVPMVPFGAGSSIEGNFSSPYSGICIDFVHMDKIIAFHPDE